MRKEIDQFQFSEQFETLKVVELFEWGIWNKFGHTRKKGMKYPLKRLFFVFFIQNWVYVEKNV